MPETCRVLLIEDAPCLSDGAVRAIADFIRSGGRVIASPNTAWYDDIGRLRPRSALWETLGLNGPPDEAMEIGSGEIIALQIPASAGVLIKLLEFYRFSAVFGAECSLIPSTDAAGNFIVYVCSEAPLSGDLKILAPGDKPGRAIICVSSEPSPSTISF